MVTVGWFSFHLNSRWNCKSAFLCLPWKYWFALMATLHFCHIVSHMHQRQHLECCFSEGGICSKARVEQNFSHLIPAWQYITLFPPSPGKWRMQFGHQWSKWIGKSNSRLISRHVTHLKSSSCNFLAPSCHPTWFIQFETWVLEPPSWGKSTVLGTKISSLWDPLSPFVAILLSALIKINLIMFDCSVRLEIQSVWRKCRGRSKSAIVKTMMPCCCAIPKKAGFYKCDDNTNNEAMNSEQT